MEFKKNFIPLTLLALTITACQQQEAVSPRITSARQQTSQKVRQVVSSFDADKEHILAIENEPDHKNKISLCFKFIQDTNDPASLQKLIDAIPDPLIRNAALKKLIGLVGEKHFSLLKWNYQTFVDPAMKLKIFRKMIDVAAYLDDLGWLEKEFSNNNELFQFKGGGKERKELLAILKSKEKSLYQKVD